MLAVTLAWGVLLAPVQGPQPFALPADQARHELSWRLCELQQARNRRSAPKNRRPALDAIVEAVTAFSRQDYSACAEGLDRAFVALEQRTSATRSLAVVARPPLVEAGGAVLELTVAPFYARDLPAGLAVRVQTRDGRVVRESELATLPWRERLDLGRLEPGEHELLVELRVDGAAKEERELRFSAVAGLSQRLERLGSAVPAESTGVGPATARGLHARLTSLAGGQCAEVDLRATELLSQAEDAARAASSDSFARLGPGDHRLFLPVGARVLPTRVFVPEGVAPGAPLVLALHGAFGSQDFFFDGYGAGRAASACRERGWIFAAPDLGTKPASEVLGQEMRRLLEQLSRVLPEAPAQLLLIGHSSGVGIAMRALERGTRCRAFAAVGGGSPLLRAAAFVELPLLICVGERDFARELGEGMHVELERAGAKDARLRVYLGAEHLTVVNDAFDDVFAFFDERLRR